VLRDEAVTVTCSVHDGVVRWWLTRESGQCPPCTAVEGDLQVERRGYVVVKFSAAWWWRSAQWSEVLVSLVSVEALLIVHHRVARLMRHLSSSPVVEEEGAAAQTVRRWIELAGSVSDWLERGAFSGDYPCPCFFGHVCRRCREAAEVDERFVCQRYFDGAFPYGEQSWWTGVTDGVGAVCGDTLWKQCRTSCCRPDGRHERIAPCTVSGEFR
jgi:hypothetical protein